MAKLCLPGPPPSRNRCHKNDVFSKSWIMLLPAHAFCTVWKLSFSASEGLNIVLMTWASSHPTYSNKRSQMMNPHDTYACLYENLRCCDVSICPSRITSNYLSSVHQCLGCSRDIPSFVLTWYVLGSGFVIHPPKHYDSLRTASVLPIRGPKFPFILLSHSKPLARPVICAFMSSLVVLHMLTTFFLYQGESAFV